MNDDRYADWDGAYLLGALDDADRRSFEAHLETCAACRTRVEEVRPTAALLSALPPSAFDDPDPVPDTLLPRLLRAAARERSRRRLFSGSLGAVAAACAAALVVLLWPAGSGTSGPAPRALATVSPSPVSATAQLVSRAWGTEIDLHCQYALGADGYLRYKLVALGADGRAYAAGSWTLTPGGTTNFTGGTALTRSDIDAVQIRTADGTPILQLAT